MCRFRSSLQGFRANQITYKYGSENHGEDKNLFFLHWELFTHRMLYVMRES